MNITKHNCESWFLDYYEKTLSPVEVAEVLFFLEENPEFKEVFESYRAVFLEHDKVNFPDKESLKKKYTPEELDRILASEISTLNCEQFFVARAEGLLSEVQVQELESFLVRYPERKKDFDLIQKCKLTGEKISFEHKDLLKKETVTAGNREEYFIRSVENDLSPAEQKQLAFFLQKNPEYKKELEQFKNTVLVPENISFGFKSELKKKERRPAFVYLFTQQRTYYAAAAAILLLAGLFFFFSNNNDGTGQMADKTNRINNTIVKQTPAPVNPGRSMNALEQGPVINDNEQPAVASNLPVKKKTTMSVKKSKQDIFPQPFEPENKTEEALIAKKEETKKEETKVEGPVLAATSADKKDSARAEVSAQAVKDTTVPAASAEAVASAVKIQVTADDYQTVSSFVNKKVRSLLGIKRSTECDNSEKIGLWELAMAAKNGVQKVIGAKALDVQKVCDGKGENVEYVFTAGNFEISKSTVSK